MLMEPSSSRVAVKTLRQEMYSVKVSDLLTQSSSSDRIRLEETVRLHILYTAAARDRSDRSKEVRMLL